MTATAGFWVHEKTCAATVEGIGPTARLTISGTVHERSLKRLFQESHRLLKPPPIYWGLQVDFSTALLLLDDQALANVLLRPNPMGQWCPTAIVAGHQFHRFGLYADLCSSPRHARVTRVFLTDGHLCQQWLTERQWVHEQMLDAGLD